MDERRIWLLVTSQQLLAHLAEAGPSRPLWQHKIHVGHSGGDSQWQIRGSWKNQHAKVSPTYTIQGAVSLGIQYA